MSDSNSKLLKVAPKRCNLVSSGLLCFSTHSHLETSQGRRGQCPIPADLRACRWSRPSEVTRRSAMNIYPDFLINLLYS
jgi:hypothetical protein